MPAKPFVADFTNVQDASDVNSKRMPEGEYRAKVIKAEDHISKNSNPQVRYVIVLANHRASYAFYCGKADKELWKLRNLFIAAGFKVPKQKVKLDPNKVVDREIGVSLEDDEYEGKDKSTIKAVFPLTELPEHEPTAGGASNGQVTQPVDEDEEEPEDEETPATPAPKAAAKPKVIDDDGAVDEEELEELDVTEL